MVDGICPAGTTSLKNTGCLAVGSSDPRHVWSICLEKKKDNRAIKMEKLDI
jgi:hypothetical protein